MTGIEQNSFDSIWVAPSIILGLGIARLLSDSVTVFRSRDNGGFYWVPVVWAFCIFIWQVQYLWGVIELPSLLQVWSIVDFVLLLGLSLFLFIASALIFPDSKLKEGVSLAESFRKDGRWALLALSAWGCNAVIVNYFLFGESLFTYNIGILFIIIIFPLLFLAINSKKTREYITIINIIITLYAAYKFSPISY